MLPVSIVNVKKHEQKWRRARDSNPRKRFYHFTRLAGVRLQPTRPALRLLFTLLLSRIKKPSGGGGGIRTHGAGAARTTVFKTVAFNRSATPPSRIARTRIAYLLRKRYRIERIFLIFYVISLELRFFVLNDSEYMQHALDLAKEAALLGEVPIGAVVVCDGAIVGTGYNRREIDNDPAGHAEFIALMQASRHLGRWRLSDCTVYVTLEPCVMCAGLMHQARIARCVYAAPDPKAGALGTLYNVHEDERLNHSFEVDSGVLEEESAALLKEFFKKLRTRPKKAKSTEAETQSHAEHTPPEANDSSNLTERTLTRTPLYHGRIFDLETQTVELPNGKTALRDIIRHPGATAVLAINDKHEVLLVDQWRTALGEVLREIPAGKLEPGEDPLECAKRELKEETGIVAESIEHLTTIATSAGFCDEHLHIYIATGLNQEETNRDDDEFMNMIWVPFDEALETCKQATMIDSKTIIALTLYALKR